MVSGRGGPFGRSAGRAALALAGRLRRTREDGRLLLRRRGVRGPGAALLGLVPEHPPAPALQGRGHPRRAVRRRRAGGVLNRREALLRRASRRVSRRPARVGAFRGGRIPRRHPVPRARRQPQPVELPRRVPGLAWLRRRRPELHLRQRGPARLPRPRFRVRPRGPGRRSTGGIRADHGGAEGPPELLPLHARRRGPRRLRSGADESRSGRRAARHDHDAEPVSPAGGRRGAAGPHGEAAGRGRSRLRGGAALDGRDLGRARAVRPARRPDRRRGRAGRPFPRLDDFPDGGEPRPRRRRGPRHQQRRPLHLDAGRVLRRRADPGRPPRGQPQAGGADDRRRGRFRAGSVRGPVPERPGRRRRGTRKPRFPSPPSAPRRSAGPTRSRSPSAPG